MNSAHLPVRTATRWPTFKSGRFASGEISHIVPKTSLDGTRGSDKCNNPSILLNFPSMSAMVLFFVCVCVYFFVCLFSSLLFLPHLAWIGDANVLIMMQKFLNSGFGASEINLKTCCGCPFSEKMISHMPFSFFLFFA